MTSRAPVRFGTGKPAECLRGHSYTPDNTRETTNAQGHVVRRCRTCEREWTREYKARRKANV
jgi:hypothetical protein